MSREEEPAGRRDIVQGAVARVLREAGADNEQSHRLARLAISEAVATGELIWRDTLWHYITKDGDAWIAPDSPIRESQEPTTDG